MILKLVTCLSRYAAGFFLWAGGEESWSNCNIVTITDRKVTISLEKVTIAFLKVTITSEKVTITKKRTSKSKGPLPFIFHTYLIPSKILSQSLINCSRCPLLEITCKDGYFLSAVTDISQF